MVQARADIGPGNFVRSRDLGERLHAVVPGGGHTYAKGDDQFPLGLAPIITHGRGARVWDVDGNEFIEYGSGLRAVSLGHVHPIVTARVADALQLGLNFVRPGSFELEVAERVLALFPTFDRIKFAKNGSDVTTAAVRLARAHTGRDLVAVCTDQPFFSTDDWFIGRTEMPLGVPSAISKLTIGFPYGDVAALEALFEQYPEQIACIVMEAATIVEPPDGYFTAVRAACDRHGVVFILDEMITGFRWDVRGAHTVYGIRPDLATFGKALGNGFAISALVGRGTIMDRGGMRGEDERVFLLSTTHGAETVGLAAAMGVLDVYETEPVIETLYARGNRLREGVARAAAAAGVQDHLLLLGRPCNLVFHTLDGDGERSPQFRTLFMSELIRRGILALSFVVSAALTEDDIDYTVGAVAEACATYRSALDRGVGEYLHGRAVKPAFRPYG
jgi:glutamate-1-semialdehyde 2,1-aminomutase